MTSGSGHLAAKAADDNPDLDNGEAITVWQPYGADPLTREDARQTAYLDMLLRWAAEGGEFEPPAPLVVDLVTTAEWVELRTAIMRALEPYPEALQALEEAR